MVQILNYFVRQLRFPFAVNPDLTGSRQGIYKTKDRGIYFIYHIDPLGAVNRLNQQDQEGNQHNVTGRCKIEMECPEWYLKYIVQVNFFDQEEPDMVDDKYQSREIEKNNPEEELTQKREDDLLYHKSKSQNYKIS
jgi:hypothetical protein